MGVRQRVTVEESLDDVPLHTVHPTKPATVSLGCGDHSGHRRSRRRRRGASQAPTPFEQWSARWAEVHSCSRKRSRSGLSQPRRQRGQQRQPARQPFLKRMGQRVAKQQMQAGVRLYHQRHHQQAVAKWTNALNTLQNPEDRFITLGYLAQAFCDAGDCEATLHYSLLQMELASEKNDESAPYMKSEAFLNLAKAYERLADYSKALSYGKASLQHPSMDPRTPGYAHLTIALAYLGVSQFQSALEACEQAMHVANNTDDRLLELQVCVALGSLFTLLRDLTKALIFLRNALAVVQTVTIEDVHAKYRALALLHLSIALRLRGSLVDAKEACDEALRLSAECGNRTLHARCLCSLADIFRELGESEAKETITKSWARYEEAFRIMRACADRQGEMLVLASMAKSASESRSHYSGQCECQAISLNKKCLEIARIIGCKHSMLKCHMRLAELYAQLNDDDSEEVARKAVSSLTQEMELFCNFCGQRYATKDDSLQALRCSHIFHERCLQKFLRERADQTCPKCRCRAFLSDTISLRTPSVCSMDIDAPSSSRATAIATPPFVPTGAVRTPLVGAATGNPPETWTAGVVASGTLPRPHQTTVNDTGTIKRNNRGNHCGNNIGNYAHSSQRRENHLPSTSSNATAATTLQQNRDHHHSCCEGGFRVEQNHCPNPSPHDLPPPPPPMTTTTGVDEQMTAEMAESIERLESEIMKKINEQRRAASVVSNSASPVTGNCVGHHGPSGTLTKKPPAPPPPPRKPKPPPCCSHDGLDAIDAIINLPPPAPISEHASSVICRIAPTITDV